MCCAEISIIIPVYNAEKYLRQCLDSIINQTFKDIEIICIDDCSKDNSLDILKNYSLKDERIKIIPLEKNQGTGFARNKGIDVAKGKYITFVDGDDYITDDFIQKHYEIIENNNVDIVISNLENIVSEENNENLAKMKQSFDDFYKFCSMETGTYDYEFATFKQLRTGLVAKFYKKSIIDKFNIKFPEGLINEDEAFYWFYMVNVKKIYFLNEKLYKRIVHNSSIMYKLNIMQEKAFNLFEVVQKVYEFLIQYNIYKKYKDKFKEFFYTSSNNIKSRCSGNKNLLKKVKKLTKEYERKYKLKSRFQNILSIYNEKRYDKSYKVFCIIGIKFKIRRKNA